MTVKRSQRGGGLEPGKAEGQPAADVVSEKLTLADISRGIDQVAELTLELASRVCGILAPPPKLTVSQWADKYRILPDTSAEPGQWRTDRAPWTREPMDACCDPRVDRVVLMFGAQMAKTEIELNIAGYYIDNDPAPMLMIQPTIEDAEDFSKERLAPMLADTPALAEKVSDPKSRNGSNTILRKEFPGGFVGLVGANAPRGLRRRPVRTVLADEIDGYPASAGTEGNPLDLAHKRTTTFWNSLMVVSSTPTNKGESAIEKEYTDSTQEQWQVPCPSCGKYQPYNWDALLFHKEAGVTEADSSERPDEPLMACQFCGKLSGEYDWKAGAGKWVARAEHASTRGFHINAMASVWLSWPELIAEFIKAKREGPESLKTFVNTRLAECWEEAGEALDEEVLAARRHYYSCDVPDGVTWITCGVDVQQDRLELEVVGWGPGKESWGIEYAMLPGDPNRSAVWQDLDEFLQRTWVRADGAILPISCTAVDSGFATSAVYAFTKKRAARYIFAVKGQGGPGLPVVGPWRRQGKNKDVAVFPVGTDAAKDLLLTRLTVDAEGPGYCHFPREERSSEDRLRGYAEGYFKGLMGEKRVERKSRGRVYHTWIKRSSHVRNEPLDCRVYATAALEIRNADLSRTAKVTASGQVPNAGKPQGRRVISKGVS